MAASLRPTAHSSAKDRSQDLDVNFQDNIRPSPQVLITPASSREESLKSESPLQSPSRRVLFSYRHVFFIFRKSAASLSSLVLQKNAPELKAKSATMATTQPKSIMSLKFDRLKDKWRDFERRSSPRGCRCAGYIFLVIMLLILASVIVGWYGLSKDTLAHLHQTVTTDLPQTTPTVVDYHDSYWPTQTPTQGPWYLFHEGVTIAPTVPPAHHVAAELDPKTSFDETNKVTVVRTIIITVTSIITDTSLKTLTTTVILSTCTTCITTPTVDASTDTKDSQKHTTGIMTGIMYCSFTGRRNIYTLCPLVHTDSPGMLTGAPLVVSSATPMVTNPFSAVRLAAVSLWNSIPSLSRVMQTKDQQRYDCECAGMRKKLDAAVKLIRIQQKLLDSQRILINDHRKGLSMVLETVANMTAVKVGKKTSRDTPPLNLNI
ncbi:hypothetical protein F5B22DRAFT_424815 [Xylaria bambusicola]|uniref:uncharacterized protein n=1 Tax=Xylaria bambusicola TaxID=326684 RepID=UPI00200758AE|nr:uncharacterized protein F5B22DRAFT_424815 [Xylaria bambusicola]KAI0508279.1 hypothetical protein F5B22DRAFT_424815 [Xylaria bambusicola]